MYVNSSTNAWTSTHTHTHIWALTPFQKTGTHSILRTMCSGTTVTAWHEPGVWDFLRREIHRAHERGAEPLSGRHWLYIGGNVVISGDKRDSLPLGRNLNFPQDLEWGTTWKWSEMRAKFHRLPLAHSMNWYHVVYGTSSGHQDKGAAAHFPAWQHRPRACHSPLQPRAWSPGVRCHPSSLRESCFVLWRRWVKNEQA